MRMRFLPVVLLSLPLAGSAQTATLFDNVRIFDGARIIERGDVLVRDGRIVQVAPQIAVPAGARVIDGAGKTLLPGLIDAHTHAWGPALRTALMFGVTTELD